MTSKKNIILSLLFLVGLANASGFYLCENIFTKTALGEVTMKSSHPFKKLKNILVISAMDVENEAILKHVPSPSKISLNQNLQIEAGVSHVGNHNIYFIKSGVGIVNGALAASYAIDYLKPDVILLLGVAGSLSQHLKIGDVVVADSILQHDAVYSGELGHEYMAPGELYLSVEKNKRISPIIDSSLSLSQWISFQLKNQSMNVFSGVILSGSEFVGSTHRKIELSKTVENALAVEMEAAGVAQIARKSNIPFVVVKTIADRLNPDGTISSDYLKFSESASSVAGLIVQSLLIEWGK